MDELRSDKHLEHWKGIAEATDLGTAEVLVPVAAIAGTAAAFFGHAWCRKDVTSLDANFVGACATILAVVVIFYVWRWIAHGKTETDGGDTPPES